MTISVSLYANDMVIFCHQYETELHGLQHPPLHVRRGDIGYGGSTGTLLCQIPRHPPRDQEAQSEAFQPLVDRPMDHLRTLKASMMPKVGCLALVKPVIAVIPLHQLAGGSVA